jgi:hypothetical protein
MRRFNRYLRGMIKVIFRDYKGESILKWIVVSNFSKMIRHDVELRNLVQMKYTK